MRRLLLLSLGLAPVACVFDRSGLNLLQPDRGPEAMSDRLSPPETRRDRAGDRPGSDQLRPDRPPLRPDGPQPDRPGDLTPGEHLVDRAVGDLDLRDHAQPDVEPSCDALYGSVGGYQLCLSAPGVCIFTFDPPGGGKRSCADACGSRCLEAYAADPQSMCSFLAKHSCTTNARVQICVCQR